MALWNISQMEKTEDQEANIKVHYLRGFEHMQRGVIQALKEEAGEKVIKSIILSCILTWSSFLYNYSNSFFSKYIT